jgi:uncharacterized tellurite resistance protein B-like protein
MDFDTFFDIYIQPRSSGLLNRDGIEFRYTAASLLIACSKSDMDEDPEEQKVIRQILADTFQIGDTIIDKLIKVGSNASEGEYLKRITTFVNEQFTDRDKHFLLEKLWLVAYADGRIEAQEQAFIDRIASAISMTSQDIETARVLAQRS